MLQPIREVSKESGRTLWLCQCDCGNTTVVRRDKVFITKSCGCLKIAQWDRVKHMSTHGMTKTSEWVAWKSMKERCLTPSHTSYKNYGARGIKVCEHWVNNFENFLADMGPKPDPLLTLERIDVNGNYEPANCKWATWHDQRMNQRRMSNPAESAALLWLNTSKGIL